MVIRPSQRTDAQSMSRIYVQTWQDTYLSIVPYGYLSTMSVSRQEKAFYNELTSKQVTSFVAEEAGQVIGLLQGVTKDRMTIYTAVKFTPYMY